MAPESRYTRGGKEDKKEVKEMKSLNDTSGRGLVSPVPAILAMLVAVALSALLLTDALGSVRPSFAAGWASITEFPVITDPGAQEDPDISGNLVVWRSQFQIQGRKLPNGATFPIANVLASSFEPSVSGNWVAWAGPKPDSPPGSQPGVYVKNIDTQQLRTLRQQCDTYCFHAVISGNWVAWQERREDGRPPRTTRTYKIFAYNLVSGEEISVEPATTSSLGYPDIDGNVVVWTKSVSSTGNEVFGKALPDGSIFQISTSSKAGNPAISGNLVVWRELNPAYYEIWGRRLSGVDHSPTGAPFPIATGSGWRYYVDVSGEVVVWWLYNGVSHTISGKNISTGEEYQISSPAAVNPRDPAISGDIIVWADERNGGPGVDSRDIYGARPGHPPVCTSAQPSMSEIWPANHKFVDVGITGVTDPDGDTLTIKITSIRQDEPTNSLGDGDTSPDGQGIGTSTAKVRAERSGTGNGRVYTIGFTATDPWTASCSGSVKVSVPHNKGESPIDGGPTYDSTVP